MPSPQRLYGKQTQLAISNFPISGWAMPHEVIRILAFVKKHAALVNGELGVIPKGRAKAIAAAAAKVSDGKYDNQFPVDVFQTGSGTSTNMNMNEVLANLASTKARQVHPNDHVNACQSSNDVIPTAIQIACAMKAKHVLVPVLAIAQFALHQKAVEWHEVITTGRTHLMDAVPVRLGDTFDAFSALIAESIESLYEAIDTICILPLGGTAAGTGLNAHPRFAKTVIKRMCKEADLNLEEAPNHIAAQSCPLSLLKLSAALRQTAVALEKIANDIRHLGSGPIAGLAELELPALQAGSSIMPGKVNPVLCESVLQVSMYVQGVDATVQAALARGSNFQLHTAYPLVAHSLISALRVLGNVTDVFTHQCLAGIEANEELITARTERNPMLATALNPVIGYDAAAKIAKEAMMSGETIFEVAKRRTDLSDKMLKKLLRAEKMC